MGIALTWLTGLTSRYPVITLDVGKFVVSGGVALGWWAAPAQPVTDVATVVGVVVFALLSWATHSSVSPADTPSAVAPAPDGGGKHEAP